MPAESASPKQDRLNRAARGRGPRSNGRDRRLVHTFGLHVTLALTVLRRGQNDARQVP